MLRKLILFFCTAILAACGGSSSGASVPSPAPGPAPAPVPTPAPEPVRIDLKPKLINLENLEVFVKFRSAESSSTDKEDNSAKTQTYKDVEVVRKMYEGKVSPIPVEYSESCDDEGNCTMCESVNLEDYELDILEATELEEDSYYVKISYPNVVTAQCEVGYTEGYFIINSDGNVFELPQELPFFDDIFSPDEEGTNLSESLVVTNKSLSELYRLDISSEVVDLNQINQSGDRVWEGAFAFDGQYSLSTSSTYEGWRLINIDEPGFTIIRAVEDYKTNPIDGFMHGIFIDHEGDFILMDHNHLTKVNLDGSLECPKWLNCTFGTPEITYNWGPWKSASDSDIGMGSSVPNMYLFRGRHNTTIMSDRCFWTDYMTGNWKYISRDGSLGESSSGMYQGDGYQNPQVAKLRKGKIYCVDPNNYLFSMYFIDDEKYSLINTDDYGIEVINYEFSKHIIGFWGQDTTSGDYKFQEYNFLTDTFTDYGVIESGDGRKAYQLIPIN